MPFLSLVPGLLHVRQGDPVGFAVHDAKREIIKIKVCGLCFTKEDSDVKLYDFLDYTFCRYVDVVENLLSNGLYSVLAKLRI